MENILVPSVYSRAEGKIACYAVCAEMINARKAVLALLSSIIHCQEGELQVKFSEVIQYEMEYHRRDDIRQENYFAFSFRTKTCYRDSQFAA